LTEKDITIMAVHAHPDDEVVFTGGTLALYHDKGVRTVLVTATGGEEGEIHDPDLDADEARPRLREIRLGELRRGIEILGIDHLELLGYRDSGMVGTEPNARPDNFHNADPEEATCKLVALVRKYKPQILITYDEFGAYGHPDHIACNKITHATYDKASDPSYHPELGDAWQPLKLYYTHWNEEGFTRAHEMYKERGLKWPFDREEEEKKDDDPQHEDLEEVVTEQAEQAEQVEEAKEEEKPPQYVPPPVTTRINVLDAQDRKWKSILMHRTQFSPEGAFMTMPEDIRQVAFGEEHYSLVASRIGEPGAEDDILAGLM
jgi:LmbE family N-acetylglucosaminyl deacetylase